MPLVSVGLASSALKRRQALGRIEARAKSLQAAADFFDLIYNGTGEIHIAAKNEPQPKD